MPMFTKKPITIEAVQLTETSILQTYQFIHGKKAFTPADERHWENYEDCVLIVGMDVPTLEDGPDGRAKHVATIGDWIIKGIKGEFYPCKPDIFAATYSPA